MRASGCQGRLRRPRPDIAAAGRNRVRGIARACGRSDAAATAAVRLPRRQLLQSTAGNANGAHIIVRIASHRRDSNADSRRCDREGSADVNGIRNHIFALHRIDLSSAARVRILGNRSDCYDPVKRLRFADSFLIAGILPRTNWVC
jgi:hypothetical protein